ncbi:MAG: CHAT domain-containing protein [Fulvivirga sp.]|uniref:CHAT domain-containing tetratricopeptide repeat protein n=1 Tax=Fulvivirga sp. TaxID=1931237 RepID=UPI0032EDA37F
MLKNILTFTLFIITTNLFSQDRYAFYYNLEQLIETDKLEELVQQEAKISQYVIPVDTLSADIYAIIGEGNLILGEYEKAQNLYEKALGVRRNLNPLATEGFSSTLYNLVNVHLVLGHYAQALQLSEELLAVDEKLYGKSSIPYFQTVLFRADVLIETSKYDKALKLLNSQKKQLEDEYNIATLNAKKGDVLSLLGNYNDAQQLLSEASEVYASLNDTLSYALTQSAQGLNYMNMGKYPQAEYVFLESRDQLANLPDADYLADGAKSNLALAQLALGRQQSAIDIYETLRVKDSVNFGLSHPAYITTLINIGDAYYVNDEFDNAINSLTKALELAPDVYGANSEVEATILNNLAKVKSGLKDYSGALADLKRSQELFAEVYGKNSFLYSTATFNLGKVQLMMKSQAADKSLLEAGKIRKKVVGDKHPKYAEVTNYLGIYYWQQNDLKKARKYFEETFTNFLNQIKLFFPSLSEEEKTKFYLEKLKPAFEQYNTLGVRFMKDDPSILANMYNYQLQTKGIIMAATERLRKNIYNSSDSTLMKDYEDWKSLKERLSKLYSNNDPRQNYIDSLNQLANELERSLVRRSSDFAKVYDQQEADWKAVQEKLGDNEVAVEIIRYRVSDPKLAGEFTNDINYLALIIDKNSDYPKPVHFTRGSLMEGRYLNNYRNSIRYQIEDRFTYDELWEPMKDQFEGVKKIYISPDGVYNQVNLSTLVNPETGEYLIKEIEIQEVTSTRDLLVESKASGSSSADKYLFGFPMYTTNGTELTASKKERSLRGGLRGGGGFSETRGLRGGLLRYMRSGEGIATLPGTKTEVEEIEAILSKDGDNPKTLITDQANETAIKQVSNPEVLHIATHGYFLENIEPQEFGESKTYYQNPLLRAGLILAGAEDFLLTGSNSIDNEDGILTAYEAMNMDLNNTDLVVLSACETGLGEVSNGEGVYGLQRAFKIAGARYIIMSMWNVDDDATQRLMTLFYEHLSKGKEKYYAFRDAQLQLMEEYEQPFYWGAFKIVGQ